MRVQKKVLFLSVFLMIVGFAAVSTTLYLNGEIGIGTNEPDFDVYFSKAIEDGIENNTLIQDKRHLSFTTELSKINEKYVLVYDVTNASKQYDASIIINCTGGNDYLRVENKFNVVEDLKARSTRSGRLTLTVIKSVFEETEVNITCEITGRAVERIETGGDIIEEEQVDYLKQAETSSSPTTYLGHELDRSKVESITLKDTKEVPEGVEFWDVSNSGNRSILAYTLDEDNNDLLELYIGQNGGLNANPNSSYLIYYFTNATSINGLEYLDTSNVTNMSSMFNHCSSLTSLDASRFDTSNVTSMSNMFYFCSSLTSLDVNGFDTSNVTRMSGMFSGCSNLTSLDVSHFNTGNVTKMDYMFDSCVSLTNLDISSFDTSQVTNMRTMFSFCKSLISLDLSRFDTSNVTDMGSMFSYCNSLEKIDVSHFDTKNVTGMYDMFRECRKITDLDLSHFDTKKVTGMSDMFCGCSNLINLDLSHFDISNVTNMAEMFSGCNNLITTITIYGKNCKTFSNIFSRAATSENAQITVNYTEDASDLVDQMIATKSDTSNVVKGNIVV